MLATLGVVLPAFVIILMVASLVTGLLKYAGVKSFLNGLRPVVIGLIVGTGVIMFISVMIGIKAVTDVVLFDWKALVIFSIVAGTHFIYKQLKKKTISPIILIIISAILGLIFYGLIS